MDKRIGRYIRTPLKTENIDEISFQLHGIIADIIFKRDYFAKNIDIRTFTIETLEKDYKKYLFASRTILYARIIKDLRICTLNDPDNFIHCASNVKKFLEQKNIDPDNKRKKATENQKKSAKSKNKKIDPIDEWRQIINPKQ